MSSLAGSQDAWSVSNTDAGCYLMSPRRTDSSRLAIGRHPKLGAGLFIVNFRLSVPRANAGEPVTIQAAGGDLNRLGRIVGTQLLFVPLDASDISASLLVLKQAGTLGLLIKRTWIAHGGQKAAEAIALYDQAGCSLPGRPT
jgi:hypothetical protein